MLQHERRCGRSEETYRNEERFWQLSDKVDKNQIVGAELAAELQGLQAGGERRGSNALQAVECCLETTVETDIRYRNGPGEV